MTVTQVNNYIKALLESSPELVNVSVSGEASNYRVYPSGHHYFTLKDEESVLKCVMFKGDASKLVFKPLDGMKLIAIGRVSVYPRDGQYQLYCRALQPDGVGALAIAFEQLKQRLYAEGLFDERYKKPLPKFPKSVTLITSPAGAVARDMLRILRARWPLCAVNILPVRVQGEEAPPEIAEAIEYANAHNLGDVLIVGRGGGSLEDLWAFNDENVARAIFKSRIPIISAVGHEPDVTIADFVADVRASTPSNAAEIVSPNHTDWRQRLDNAHTRMARGINRSIKNARTTADTRLLERAVRDGITAKRSLLARYAAKLDALSPLKVFARGYSVALNAGGETVKRVKDVKTGEDIYVRFIDGQIKCEVKERIGNAKAKL
ncbi:MAG: exodeoxyribonuclease VII large subunit [Oscillospiraceae bacterium]|nr:exodeoxyribonuclease VII large subunit [Oscillospiraceae bacterium]